MDRGRSTSWRRQRSGRGVLAIRSSSAPRRVESFEVSAVTWAIAPELCRPGDLLTRAEVCHLHDSSDEAEQCGIEPGRAPELVKLERRSERVHRVWSLSDAAGGRLRRSIVEG